MTRVRGLDRQCDRSAGTSQRRAHSATIDTRRSRRNAPLPADVDTNTVRPFASTAALATGRIATRAAEQREDRKPRNDTHQRPLTAVGVCTLVTAKPLGKRLEPL